MFEKLVELKICGSWYYITIQDRGGVYTARQHGVQNAFNIIKRLDHSKAIKVTKNGKTLPWKVLYTNSVINGLLENY